MFLVSSCSCLCQSNEARCKVENEDVVWAAPTGDAPTTSEWSTILLPTKVCLILETWRYVHQETNHHWFRLWLVAWSVPNHYLKRCWNIVSSTHGSKLQWHSKRNSYIFIQGNVVENVICEMAVNLSQPQYIYSTCTDQTTWRDMRSPGSNKC